MLEYYLSEAIKYFSGSNTNGTLYMPTAAPDMSCQCVGHHSNAPPHVVTIWDGTYIISIFVVSKINNL